MTPLYTVNLDTIARKVGVSKMTVSRALRGESRVSPATREKILKAANELGWKPNALVSTLMSHVAGSKPIKDRPTLMYTLYHSTQIDVVKVKKGTGSGYYQGGYNRAGEQGFNFDLIQLNREEMSADRFSAVMKARNIPGIIIGPGDNPEVRIKMNWSDIAAVAIGYSLVYPAIHRVCLDYHRGMMECLSLMWERGHRKFGLYMPYWTDVRIRHLWSSAFLVFHWKQGILAPDSIYTPQPRINKTGLTQWLDKVRPEVFFICGGDEVREMVRETEQELGIAPSKLVHLDRDFMRSQGNMPEKDRKIDYYDYYASIDQNRMAMGATALDLLVGQIKRNERGIPIVQQTCLIMPKIIFH